MGKLVLKLIDIDACGSIFKKVKMSEYKIVSLTDGTGPFYKLDTSDVLSRPHRNIYLKIGTGLYIYTENEELLDEARSWVTDIEEVEDGEYAITHKDYFIFRESFIDRSVSDRYKKILRDITKYSKPVYTLADNNIVGSLNEAKNSNQSYELGYLIPRYKIEELLDNGIDNMPFKEDIDVYTLTVNGFVKRSVMDALDIPRTVIKSEKSDYKKAKKMGLFYRFNPLEKRPVFLDNASQVEFEPVNMTSDGLVIYKKSIKIVQNMHKAEYFDAMMDNNNFAGLEIDENAMPKEIYDILVRLYGSNDKNIVGVFDKLVKDIFLTYDKPSKEFVNLCKRCGLDPNLGYQNLYQIFGVVSPSLGFDEESYIRLKDLVDSLEEFDEYPAEKNKNLYTRQNEKEKEKDITVQGL